MSGKTKLKPSPLIPHSSLQHSWKVIEFGNIAENIAVRVKPSESDSDIYVGLEHLDPETLHLKKWGHPSDVEGDKLRFWKGDIIFGRRRAYQRKLAIADFDGICSAHAIVLRAKPENIRPDFLPFFLQSDMFMERAIGISVGSLSPTINWKTLREEEFPLPPLQEQKRIAEILWAADEAVESYKVSLKTLDHLAANLVSGFLNRDSNIELSALGEWTGGGTPSKTKAAYWRGAIPWVSPKDLKCDELFDSEDHINEQAIMNSSTKIVPQGAVLIAIRTGILRHTFPVVIAGRDMAINQDLKALLPNDSFLPEFVASFLRMNAKRILRECVKSGTTVESIDFGLFKRLRIPLPTIAVQKEFIEILNKLKVTRTCLSGNIRNMKNVMAGILHEMDRPCLKW